MQTPEDTVFTEEFSQKIKEVFSKYETSPNENLSLCKMPSNKVPHLLKDLEVEIE